MSRAAILFTSIGALFVASLTGAASSKDSASLDSVLELASRAVGDPASLERLHAIEARGTYEGEFEGTVSFVLQHAEDKMRFNIVAGEREVLWAVINNRAGYMRDPLTGTLTELPQEAAFRDLRSLGLVLDLTSKSARRKFEYKGRSDIDGRESYDLLRTYRNGDFARVRIDTATGLIWMVVETRGLGDNLYTVVRTYDDYREVDGVMLAHKIREESRAGWREFRMDSFELDLELDPAIFEPPQDTGLPATGAP